MIIKFNTTKVTPEIIAEIVIQSDYSIEASAGVAMGVIYTDTQKITEVFATAKKMSALIGETGRIEIYQD